MSRKRDGVVRYWGSLVFVEEASYKSAAKIILKENWGRVRRMRRLGEQ